MYSGHSSNGRIKLKRQKWIILAGIIVLGLVTALITIKKIRPQKSESVKSDTLRVVILDSGDYYYSDEGIENGIRLATADLEKETGVKVKLKRVDDGGDYVNGISMAKALAEDDTADVVISFQNFESIGAEAGFFEEAGKPFVVTMGCYDEVAEKGYSYLITDFLSGKTIGKRIGEYLKEKGRKNIALCHSDTTFEKDEMKGIQSAVRNAGKTNIYHTQTGPFDDSGLSELLVECDRLQLDTLVANFYTQTDSAWLLSMMRKKRPDMLVIGDYALDSSEILKEYGKGLEGVVIVPVYPYEESNTLKQFTKQYEKATGVEFSTAAVQYYDLFQMLGKAFHEKGRSGKAIMDELKKDKGYSGVAGRISFDDKGRLVTKNCPVFVCKNKKFVRINQSERKGTVE